MKIIKPIREMEAHYHRYIAFVSDEDYDRIKDYEWHIKRDAPHLAYVICNVKGSYILLHHLITNFPKAPLEIDHIDGNGLNNTRENLRIGTRSQNQLNSKNHRNGKVMGIRKLSSGRYNVRIGKGGISIGTFDTIEEARAARRKAEANART
jgi:hypothetical protein